VHLLLLLNKRYNSCRVLAFSTIFFHSRWSWACSDHLRSFILLRSFVTSSSHLCSVDHMGRLRFIRLLSFCRDSLANLSCETRLLALCSIPATLGDLGFSVRVVSLSWFVPVIALGTRVLPLHGLAFRRFHGSWWGHACIGLGRNKWHFPDFYWYTSTSKICTSGTTYCPFDPWNWYI